MAFAEAIRLSTTAARARLSELITRVQDPRAMVVLTRHGKPVAALVSMAELKRIWASHDIEDIVENGHRPVRFRFGNTEARTEHEAAEEVQKIQLDRRMEREVLRGQGLTPIPGGEVVAELAVSRKKRWWARWCLVWGRGS